MVESYKNVYIRLNVINYCVPLLIDPKPSFYNSSRTHPDMTHPDMTHPDS